MIPPLPTVASSIGADSSSSSGLEEALLERNGRSPEGGHDTVFQGMVPDGKLAIPITPASLDAMSAASATLQFLATKKYTI